MPQLLLLAGLAYLAYGAWRQAGNFFNGINFSFIGVNISRQILKMRITNTSAATAKIQALDGQIFLDGTYIGNYINKNGFTIPARGSVDIEIKLNISAIDVITSIINKFITKSTQIGLLEIRGGITTNLGRLSFDYSYNVDKNLSFLQPIKQLIKPSA